MELDPLQDPRWDAFVASRQDRLVYHHRGWLEALARGYGHAPLALACEEGGGALLGVLPLCEARGLLSGRRLVSLPHTPIAGPLASRGEVTTALLRAAIRRIGEGGASSLQIKAGSATLADSAEGLVGRPWSRTYVRALPGDREALRFGSSRNHARLRWAVNKALKQGVETRDAASTGDLRAWYRLYLETMRSHAVPPRPYAFFEALWAGLRPEGLMRLLLAERREGGRVRLLAGSVLLHFGETVSYAFNGRRRGDLALRPNELIQWRALHDACEAGARWYDFGEVEHGQHGLAEFKAKWGAEPRMLHRYYFPAARELERGILSEEGAVRRVASAAWRRLPLAATERAGAFLYRYL
jgi:CelD/BcsL family acetyltransferase involved in cellulose biosynthesis